MVNAAIENILDEASKPLGAAIMLQVNMEWFVAGARVILLTTAGQLSKTGGLKLVTVNPKVQLALFLAWSYAVHATCLLRRWY